MVPPLASIGHTSTLQAAHCTLHSVHYALHLHLQMPLNLNMYTSYYILNTVHCTPHVYSAFGNFIASHCKHPKFARVGLKIYMAICTLIYITFASVMQVRRGSWCSWAACLVDRTLSSKSLPEPCDYEQGENTFFLANTKHWNFSVCWGTAPVRVGGFYISGGINAELAELSSIPS